MERADVIARWWPSTQAGDLIEGKLEVVAAALSVELSRILGVESVRSNPESFASLDAAFRSAPVFANVPTHFVLFRTASRWSALWTNSFLCDGYDSLSWCLTANHGLTTLHWAAHDGETTFQPGAQFTYRRWAGGQVAERSVYCGREDRRWVFHATGEPLPEESLVAYAARRVRDRLNEGRLMALLAKLDASPWSDSFYVPSDSFVARRLHVPPTVLTKEPSAVARAACG